ncbi:prephenate dehydratase [Blastococcus sp. Marseille-P5729]|uniref:prephenate dehydratase n=1 Tax=Blastococcus sp. Marseille-P5729 TaxID=2086582 RepID=UPI000D10811A|nr:prephenate dehydratase [Blastococcus sp. Marseille-P5729]
MPDSYAFLGPAGTFAQQALLSIPGVSEAVLLPCPGVPAVTAAVRSGEARYGLVPIENSVEGPVSTTTDELVVGDPLQIVREVFLPVSFVLAARGKSLDDVRTLVSHPHAHAQVRAWVGANLPGADAVTTTSTAEAAALVARGEYDAAVCASIAAENHGLAILADGIEDTKDAVTRFVLLTLPEAPAPRTGNDRTSIVVHIRQEQPGALSGVLAELASRSINLTRIESRPWRERIGEYHFILECEGHIADPRVGDALAALHRICADVRFLGSYPRADRRNEGFPDHATDEAFDEAARWLAAVRQGGQPR